jgi:hypothetical protein
MISVIRFVWRHHLQLKLTWTGGWMTSEQLERMLHEAVVAIIGGTTQILDWTDWGKPGKNVSQDTQRPGRDSNRWGTGVQHITALDLRTSKRWVRRAIIFWDLTICSLVQIHRRFGGTQWLHLQDWRVIQGKSQQDAGRKKNKMEAVCFSETSVNFYRNTHSDTSKKMSLYIALHSRPEENLVIVHTL